jgi:hypothetical protein
MRGRARPLRSTAGTGVPQRSASAAIEQFLLGDVQIASMIVTRTAIHEAQFVRVLGDLSLGGKDIVWPEGSFQHRGDRQRHDDTHTSCPRVVLPTNR